DRLDRAEALEQEACRQLTQGNRSPSDHESCAPDSRQEPIGDQCVAVARERHVERRAEETGKTPNDSQHERTPEQRQDESSRGPDPEGTDEDGLRVHMSLNPRGNERPEYCA